MFVLRSRVADFGQQKRQAVFLGVGMWAELNAPDRVDFPFNGTGGTPI